MTEPIAERAYHAETQLKREELARMKRLAASLLLAATALYAVGRFYTHTHPVWGYIVAFAEAAMIGALADWFAVVALFRHPLGVPVPHTAIVPRNKASIANGLADFVVGKFLNGEVIKERLSRYDAAQHLSDWLRQPENQQTVARYLKQAIGYGVQSIDDRRIRTFLAEEARKSLEALDISTMLAGGFDMLTRNRHHRKILHEGLNRFAAFLEDDQNEEKIAAFIRGWSENGMYQMMVGSFVPTIRNKVAEKVHILAADEGGRLYAEFDEQIEHYVQRLKSDPAHQEWINGQKNALLEHPEFRQQIDKLWSDFRDWVVLDLSHGDSDLSRRVAGWVSELEHHLANSDPLRDWLNDQIRAALVAAADSNKHMAGDLIRDEIAKWDDRYMVEQLELYLGRDLQYIRLNGTLVGGLFGLAIYAVTEWLKR